MSLVSLSGIGKRFGSETILREVSFRVERGDHLALVGANGVGKSTLLRIVADQEEPDEGEVARARGIRIAYLPQDPDFSDAETLYEAMLDAFRPAIQAQERLRELEREMADSPPAPHLVDEYGYLQSIVEHTGYDFRQQIERVLTGLKLGPRLWHVPLGTLSGGQRTRANLARTLLDDADLLLLDEPTNHLDIAALEWLEGYLLDFKRAFLMVAHDRYLLQRVTGRTLELSSGRLTVYDAPYERYVQLKRARATRMREEYDAQQRHIAETEEFIRRYGAGQRYKEARGRQKKLDRLERIQRPADEESIDLNLAAAQRTGDIVLVADKVRVGYPDKELLQLPDQVVVQRGERVALVGPNGSGKSTLLRTLLGQIPTLSGSATWGSNVSIGYYSQTLEGLQPARTVLDEVRRAKAMSEEEARSYLGRFLFSGDDVFKSVGKLSGGERSRVALAKLVLEEPNVLMLDEPTNHLDIASREALQGVLAGFKGTLIFVSHDRALIDALANQLWVVDDAGSLIRYAGTYSEFATGAARSLDVPPKTPGRERKSQSAQQRLHMLEEEVLSLAARLSEAGRTASLQQLAELTDRFANVQVALQEAQEIWVRELRTRVR